jgi:hypothetical protein
MHLKSNDPAVGDDDLDEDEKPKKDKKAVLPSFSIVDILLEKLCSPQEAKAFKSSPLLNR